ncbi:MAG: DinB family protein [Cytophagales bacterium]|nr:DinB family protein [Cytophagales bacterium]
MQRRSFLTALPLISSPMLLEAAGQPLEPIQSDSPYFIGPKPGYTPHIGVLVGKMNYIRNTVLYLVEGMSTRDLDYLHDENSNTIGAMLLHLAVTEKYYQEESLSGKFSGFKDDLGEAASDLGDRGRSMIKGNPLNFYLDALAEVRETSLVGLKEKDDEWLMEIIDEENQVNTYFAWFHVCEHEANHRGLIAYLKKRIS